MLLVDGLRRDPVGVPDALQLDGVAERPAHPALHALAKRECARAARCVVGGIDADGDDGDVVAEVVEREPDLLRGDRAAVRAGRVEKRHDDRLAAQVGEAQHAPVLVAHAEVGRRDVRRAGGACEARAGRGDRLLADREQQYSRDCGEGEQAGDEQGEAQARGHRGEGSRRTARVRPGQASISPRRIA